MILPPIILPEMVAPLSEDEEIPVPLESITLFEYTSFDKPELGWAPVPWYPLWIPVPPRTILQLDTVMFPDGLELVPPLAGLIDIHASALDT